MTAGSAVVSPVHAADTPPVCSARRRPRVLIRLARPASSFRGPVQGAPIAHAVKHEREAHDFGQMVADSLDRYAGLLQAAGQPTEARLSRRVR